MLSVQTAGCAGMERLGVPTRTSLNAPPDDRGQFICRMRVDTLQARELIAVRGDSVILNNSSNNSNSNKNTNIHQQQHLMKQQHSHQNQHYQQLQFQQQQQQQQFQNLQQNQYYQQKHQHLPANNIVCHNNSSSGNLLMRSHNNSIKTHSNIARGGIEATTLKYGNTSSGNRKSGLGSGRSDGSGGANSDRNSSNENSNSGYSYGSSINSHSNEHHQHYQFQLQQQQTLRCPHHVPLPDSEWGPDRNLQIRTAYQQSEITRSYITPAPNKTVKDVPEQLNSFLSQQSVYQSPTPSTILGSSSMLTHISYLQGHSNSNQHATSSSSTTSSNKSIFKIFSRKSSPKSLTNISSSSSLASSTSISSSVSSLTSCISTSVSSSTSVPSGSSLVTVPLSTLPISTATNLKTTSCSFGPVTVAGPSTPSSAGSAANVSLSNQAINLCSSTSVTNSNSSNIYSGLTTSTHLLTSIGAPTITTIGTGPNPALSSASNIDCSIDRIPTPPLSVLVPFATGSSQCQQQYTLPKQQLLLQPKLYKQLQIDNMISDQTSAAATLQTLKSSSCHHASSHASSGSTSNSPNTNTTINNSKNKNICLELNDSPSIIGRSPSFDTKVSSSIATSPPSTTTTTTESTTNAAAVIGSSLLNVNASNCSNISRTNSNSSLSSCNCNLKTCKICSLSTMAT